MCSLNIVFFHKMNFPNSARSVGALWGPGVQTLTSTEIPLYQGRMQLCAEEPFLTCFICKKKLIRTIIRTGCSLNIVFFSRIVESLPPLPRHHTAAIGCTKNYQPLGGYVHSHCVESFVGLLQRCRRGSGCSEL